METDRVIADVCLEYTHILRYIAISKLSDRQIGRKQWTHTRTHALIYIYIYI